MTKKEDKQAPSEVAKQQEITERQVTEDYAKQQTFSGLLGEIIWLMQQSPLHRQVFISELEWLVMQPMMLNQYRIYRKEKKPVGVVFWAKVSDEVHERMKEGNFKLRPKEWQSGDNHWIVDILAPFGNSEYFVDDAGKSIFTDKTYHYAQAKEGQLNIVTVEKK